MHYQSNSIKCTSTRSLLSGRAIPILLPVSIAFLLNLFGLLLPSLGHADIEYEQEWLGANNLHKMGLVYEAKSFPFTCYATSQHTADLALEIGLETYKKTLKEFGTCQRIRKNVVLCIWDDEEQYKKHAAIFYTSARYALAFASRDIQPNTDAIFGYVRKKFFQETLPHEMGHIIMYNLADPSAQTNVPSWLHEGFAQLQEDNLHRSMEKARLRIAKAKEEGEFLPVWQLTAPKKPMAAPGVFYSEARIFADYLIQNQEKEDTFWKLCRYVARNRGKEFEFYFRTFYPQYEDIYDINDTWETAIHNDLKKEAEKKLAAAASAIDKGRALLREKKTNEGIAQYVEAFQDLNILLSDYTDIDEKLFDDQRAWRLMGACAAALQSVSSKETTVPILPGDSIKKVQELLKGQYKVEEGDWWKFEQLGLAIRFNERDEVEEVRLSKRQAGKVGGVTVGDDPEELLILHGEFISYRIKQMEKILLEQAKKHLPDPNMDCFDEGSYPVLSSSGKYMGNLMREPIDEDKDAWYEGDWFFVKPMISSKTVSLVDFNDEMISEITLLRPEALKNESKQRIAEGSRRILAPEQEMALAIGSSEKEVIKILGEPKERVSYIVPKLSFTAKSSLSRMRIKRDLTDHLNLNKLEYPGLEVITWDDDIISIFAHEPSQADIYGIKVGDPLEKVIRVFGSTNSIMKHKRKKLAAKLDKKDVYIGLFITYKKGKNRIDVKIDNENKVSTIYAYAKEWRGRKWGDAWIME